jgi:hypothetical protein
MAIEKRITKVANPRKVYRRVMAHKKRSNRAKSSTPKIHRYNTAMLKRELKRRGARKSKSNPRPRGKAKSYKRTKARPRAKRNPFLLEWATIPMANPHSKSRPKRKRRSNSMAKSYKRRKKAPKATVRRRRTRAHNPKRVYRRKRRAMNFNPRRRRTNRRRNPRATVRRVHHRRMHNSRRRRHVMRHRNPSLFGHSGTKDMLTIVGGGLVGVFAAKSIPALIPSSLTSTLGTSSFMTVALSGVSAFAAGWAAGKFVSKTFGEAVLFGGLMQVGSQLINMFAQGTPLAGLALGDIVSTRGFTVPNQSVLPPMPVAAPASSGMSGFRGNWRAARR